MKASLGALAFAALLPAAVSAQLDAPGVSRELAEQRARTLSDIRYELSFRIPAAADSAISGTVVLELRRADAGPLVLDFAEPDRVRRVTVEGRAVEVVREGGHLTIPATELPAPGPVRLGLEFLAGDGPLNRRSDFLYTLFVPDRAHEAFPSFDQPDLKARFRLTLETPRGWSAVANGEVVETRAADEVVVHRFAETEPLPTYLFAFAAGRFEVVEAERDGRPMRLFHRETDSARVARNVDAIFDLHAGALRWLEDYTGIPYPFGKFDFVAIPSFQYNGMEHPGAILYRASSLFLDEAATRNEELGRASVIAHETAHMWFGDLVTMRWFNDVWMKEVFANLMAAKIVNPAFPDIDHELRFFLSHYPSAYGVDRTAGANPIRQELENLSDAGTLYGAIIYQKAPIVMRQLELLTGEAAFRGALRRYLRDHAFGNATWPDLVAVLDEAAELDVRAWSRVWIEEAGRPEVAVERRRQTTGKEAAVLRPRDPAGLGRVWPQRMRPASAFGPALEAAPPAAAAAAGEDTAGAMLVQGPPVTLAGSPVAVPLPEGVPSSHAVLPNSEGLGYGLFLLDDASRSRLLRGLPQLPGALPRAVAWVDLWEMMLEGRAPVDAMLDAGRRLVAIETDELVAQQVLGGLTTLYWRYLPATRQDAVAAELESLLWRRVEEVERSSLKAAYFQAWRSIARTPPAVERMRDLWAGDLEVPGLPMSERDLTTLALELAVRGVEDPSELLDRQRERIENPDRRERFDFIRPAVSADPAVRDSFFASLADVRNRAREEWVVAALSYLHHPLRAEASRHQLRPALDLLLEVQRTGDIFFPTRWLDAVLRGHRSPEAAAIVRRFIADHPDYPPRLMGKLLQAADPLFRAVMLARGTGQGTLPPP